jgi:hypothetical protein
MVQSDDAKPLHEGHVMGTEINSRNGKPYGFNGHFLGDGTIIYRATVSDQHGSYRGELSGVFDHAPGGPSPAEQVRSLLHAAIRDSVGYRV